MINKKIDLDRHPASLKDAFWYWVVGVLGDVQAVIIERKISAPVWRSFDGRATTPRVMGDRHLENAVKLCQREFDEHGEPYPAQYPALLRELHERRRLASIRTAKARVEYDEKEAVVKAKRDAQLELVSSEWVPPGDWILQHEPGSTARVYHHRSGAKVSLSRFGNWQYWHAGLHHRPCQRPRETVQAALAAALEGAEALAVERGFEIVEVVHRGRPHFYWKRGDEESVFIGTREDAALGALAYDALQRKNKDRN